MYFLFAGPMYDYCAFGLEAFVGIFDTIEEAKIAVGQEDIAQIAVLENRTLTQLWRYNSGVYSMLPNIPDGWSKV